MEVEVVKVRGEIVQRGTVGRKLLPSFEINVRYTKVANELNLSLLVFQASLKEQSNLRTQRSALTPFNESEVNLWDCINATTMQKTRDDRKTSNFLPIKICVLH